MLAEEVGDEKFGHSWLLPLFETVFTAAPTK